MTTTPTPTRAPNHTPFLVVALFAALALAAVVVLYITGNGEEVPEFTGFFLTVFVGLTGFATAVYQLGRTDQKLEEIRSNTNGTLSARDQRIAQLEAQLLVTGHTPVTTGAMPPQ